MAKKQFKTAPEVVSAAAAAATKPAMKTSASSPAKGSAKTANHTHSKPKPVETQAGLESAMLAASPASVAAVLAEPSVIEETSISANTIVIEQQEPRQAIEKLAYGYFAARGYRDGSPLEDWVRAEREYHGRN